MSRPTPSDYVPLEVHPFGHNMAVQEGAAGGVAGELDVAENIHFLHLYQVPSIVNTVFVEGGYVEGNSTSYVLRALWQRRPFVDCVEWAISALVSNDSANAATLKFEMDSDSANVEINVPAGAHGTWTEVVGRVTYDAAETVDTIEMWVKNGTGGGTLRVHSVEIRPTLSTIAAGVTTAGFIPFDSDEIKADEPMAICYRQWMHDNLEVLRKTRMDSIVGWSEDVARAAASQFETTSATYELVARIPFTSPFGCTALEWAFCAYLDAGGAGTLKLQVNDGTAEEVTLGTTWSAPYTAAQYDWNSDGSELTIKENQPQTLRVWLKSDGVNKAYLMSLNAWFEDVS